jgi:hypothetical protein
MSCNIPRRMKASYQMFSIYGITAKILCHVLFAHIQSKAEPPDYEDYGSEYRECKKIKNAQNIHAVS